MPSKPLGDQPMTPKERSRRNILKERQLFADLRGLLEETADLNLRQGHFLSKLGHKIEAHDSFKMAEIAMRQVTFLNKKLAPHEAEIQRPRPMPRRGFEYVDPRSSLVLTAEKQQEKYEAERAARRPDIKERYGHLAKAEKAEGAER